jgi:hypothetical protein
MVSAFRSSAYCQISLMRRPHLRAGVGFGIGHQRNVQARSFCLQVAHLQDKLVRLSLI